MITTKPIGTLTGFGVKPGFFRANVGILHSEPNPNNINPELVITIRSEHIRLDVEEVQNLKRLISEFEKLIPLKS